MYDSWVSRIRLFIKGKKYGRMMLDSIDNGPLVYPSVIGNWQTRPKKYSKLTEVQQLQDDYDVQETSIILHCLLPDVYALVNHQEAAKDIWDIVKLLMKGTELSHQERKCRLYNLFDKFAYVHGETLYEYPDPLALVVNSPTLYNLSQSPQYSGSSMYPPPQQFTSVYAAPIHHQYHHTLVNLQQHLVSPQPFISPSVTQHSQADFPQLDSGLAVPTFQKGEDPIECINKTMALLSAVASRFPPSNNQLRTSSNPRNQATIHDGRVIVQQVQGRQSQSFAGNRNRGIATTSRGNYAAGQPRVVKYLDAYDSDCDDLSSAKAVLMANLLSCDSDVLSEDINSSAPNDLLVLSLVERITDHVAHLDKENQTNKMVNESLTAELERYKERVAIFEQRLHVDLNKREKLIDSQMDDLIPNRNAKLAAFQQEIDTLKETLFNHVKEKECLMYRSTQAMHMLTKPQVFYDDTHKQALGYQNPFHLKKAQRIQPTLYDGSVIAKEHAVISVIDDEETLILEEESRSKMLDKQNDPISIEKKIKISPIDYSKLNKIKEDFGKRFVTQKELSAEQAFWLKHSSFSETPVTSHTPVRIEAPSELPKHYISLELTTQLNQEVFQKDNFRDNQNAPTFNQLFELNELKAQSQEKDTVIKKLKDRIKSLSGKDSVENVKTDIDEIETINIELEHSVAKLLSENENLRKEREHLKSIYKEQFDSIRKTRVQSKEHSLKNKLRKLKGKNVVDTAVSKPSATIAPGMFKLDIKPISHRLKNNRDAHEVYIEKTIENTDTLCRVKCSTSASESKSPGNTKNNRISQSLSSNKTNKVEDQSRSVKSRKNKKNHVDKTKCRSFTIIGNRCPLTRITSNKIVPPKETTIAPVVTLTSGILVYSWRPKATRSVSSSSKVKIVESKTSNSKETKQSWGSTVFDVPSSSLNDYRLSKLFSGIWTSAAQLINFVRKFLGIVRFGNDHIAKIIGLKDQVLVVASKIISSALGKSKKHSHKPKAEHSIQEKHYLLHADLCGPMRIQSINRRKYTLVIVDDYSRFTWVKFLQTKDEVPEFVIKFLKMTKFVGMQLFVTSGLIMVLNLSIKHSKLTMKKSQSHIKHPWLALHNRMALSKDETIL
ncbi:retrovirus-related pol polyprotein from transposon TNT 1-94 [Tanacetum coccineum]